jgi:transmembrane secretion effector
MPVRLRIAEAAKQRMAREPEISSLGRPLGTPIFRNLLIPDVVSDIGAFMQSTAAAWLMVSLNLGADVCGAHSNCLCFALLRFRTASGAIGDIVDRRKLILYTETWMVSVALVLAVLTIARLEMPITEYGMSYDQLRHRVSVPASSICRDHT